VTSPDSGVPYSLETAVAESRLGWATPMSSREQRRMADRAARKGREKQHHLIIKPTPARVNERIPVGVTLLRGQDQDGRLSVVVQSTATKLDTFTPSFVDATMAALACISDDERTDFMRSALENAFPVAFAVAGYKSERVQESRMLTCGKVSTGELQVLGIG